MVELWGSVVNSLAQRFEYKRYFALCPVVVFRLLFRCTLGCDTTIQTRILHISTVLIQSLNDIVDDLSHRLLLTLPVLRHNKELEPFIIESRP